MYQVVHWVAMRIEHEVFIEAPVDTVWRLTTDLEAWPDMSKTMTSVRRVDDGPLAVGSSARVKQPGQRETVWTVTVVEPPTRFVWTARALGVEMVASHDLAAEGAGCRNRLSIDLAGRGGRVLGALVGRQIRRSLATENEGFKRHAERERR
jgi:uncharacterized membrane protein